MRALAQCCTPLSTAPGRKTTGQLDLYAFADVCMSVEVFSADAAADERLVGDMLVGRKLEELEVDVSLTPNVIINNKDKSHASRRLSLRGWMADPYLKKIRLSMTGKGTEQCICSRFGSKWMKGRIRMNKTGLRLGARSSPTPCRDHHLLRVNNIGRTLFTHCIAYSGCGAFGLSWGAICGRTVI